MVMIDQSVDRDVSEDIAVINQKGIGSVEQVPYVGYSTCGFEAVRGFVAKMKRDAGVGRRREGIGVGLGQVMSIDDDVIDARGDDMIESGADKGPMVKGNEGFG